LQVQAEGSWLSMKPEPLLRSPEIQSARIAEPVPPKIVLARGAKGGIAYAASVFALGFVLGTIRIFLIVPSLGPTAAVLIETPVILAASWLLARYWMKRACVGEAIPARLLAGGVAFVTLMAFEVILSTTVFQRSVAEAIANFQTAAGAIGLAGQLAFASFPALEEIRRRLAAKSARSSS
jgi:hypothetical protein